MSSASPAPAVGAITGARGLRALATALQRVRWPDKFKPTPPPRYGGATDPLAFLPASEEALLEAGGDDRVMANWLPMALIGAPRAWLLHLSAASVASWEEPHGLFPAHRLMIIMYGNPMGNPDPWAAWPAHAEPLAHGDLNPVPQAAPGP